MGLKIITGFIVPSFARRRGGEANLDLITGQFPPTAAFTVSDHRVTGTGRFVRRPHVVLGLRRIGLFLGSIRSPEQSLDFNLEDDFLNVEGGVPTLLRIRWILLRDAGSSLVAEDGIREISYLVIGETDEPALPGLALPGSVASASSIRKKVTKKKAPGKGASTRTPTRKPRPKSSGKPKKK